VEDGNIALAGTRSWRTRVSQDPWAR